MNKRSFTIITGLFLLAFSSLGQIQIGNDIDGEAAGDNSGFSTTLSADGSVVAVGANFNSGGGPASGHVRIYELDNGSWTQIGNDIDGQTLGDQTGQATSLTADGSIIAIGEPINDDIQPSCGQVRVFENVNGTWTQIGGDINGDSFSYQMGHTVDISDDGSIVAGGAFGADVPGLGAFTGHVRVFENQSGSWVQIGSDIEGEEGLDIFGKSVSLSSDGSIIAVGAPGNPSTQEIGYVKVLQNVGGTWTQIGSNLVGTTNGFGENISLSSNGMILAIAGGYSNPEGEVQVFENDNGNWVQIGNDIVGEASGDNFGSSVSISDDGAILCVGASFHSSISNNAGRVYIYHNQGGSWVQIGNTIDGAAQSDGTGYSLKLSGDASTLSVGSIGADGSGVDAGNVKVYDLTEFVSLSELENNSNIHLFPNPTSDFVQIDLPSDLQLVGIKLYDAAGRVMLTSAKATVDLRTIPSGNYLVEIETDQGMITRKLSVQ